MSVLVLFHNPQSEIRNYYRFSAHLPQISGCSFTIPTVSVYIQQRPHFLQQPVRRRS
jgi:hypothetical protein